MSFYKRELFMKLPPWRWSALVASTLFLAACGGGGDSSSSDSSVKNPLVVDAGFGVNGSSRISLGAFNGSVDHVVEQADGKLIVAGFRRLSTTTSSEYSFGVRPASKVFVNRYLDNGQLDPSFGVGGSVEFSVRGADQSPTVNLVGDGNIYVSVKASKPCNYEVRGGMNLVCVVGDVVETAKNAWVRIDASGVFDAGTPDEGLQVSQLPAKLQVLAEPDVVQRLDLNDGKYAVLQTTYAGGGVYSWKLKQYLASGEPDVRFGAAGEVSSRCAADAQRILLDRDSNIWVVALLNTPSAAGEYGLCVEKLNLDGAPSRSSPVPIRTNLGANVSILDAKVLDDASLMVAVKVNDRSNQMKVVKYQENGVLVPGYGSQGVASLDGLSAAQRDSMQVRIRDGKGAITGIRGGSKFSNIGENRPSFLAQWRPDGALDKILGLDGGLALEDLPDYSRRSQVLIDSRQRWLLQTHTSESADVSSAGVVTLTRYVGDAL